MSASKGGTVEITLLFKHICKLITTYQVRILALINSAFIGGSITADQKAALLAFVNAAAATCAAWEALTGY